jgi:hypothetical protein
VIGHAEALGDEALQVDPAPAHDAMHAPIRACLDAPFRLYPFAKTEKRRQGSPQTAYCGSQCTSARLSPRR